MTSPISTPPAPDRILKKDERSRLRTPSTGELFIEEGANPLVAFEEYWHAHQVWRGKLAGKTTDELGEALIDGLEMEVEDLISWIGFSLNP